MSIQSGRLVSFGVLMLSVAAIAYPGDQTLLGVETIFEGYEIVADPTVSDDHLPLDAKSKGGCTSSLSAWQFFPWRGSDGYDSSFGSRRPVDATISSLIAPVPDSVLPDGARLQVICYWFVDNSTAADFTTVMGRSYVETGNQQPYLQLFYDVSATSSGTPGVSRLCESTNLLIDRITDNDFDQQLEYADYFVAAGPTWPATNDPDVRMMQVWFTWQPPTDWDGECH